MTALPSLLTQRLLQLVSHTPDFVQILDAAGMVQAVSAAFRALSGYDPSDIVGHHYLSIFHSDDRDLAEESFARAVSGMRAETVKIRYRTRGGSCRTILATMQSFLGDPAIQSIVVATRDITDNCDLGKSLLLANAQVADLSERMAEAAEIERKYLGAELHDDVQQILVGLCLEMAPSRRRFVDQVPTEFVDGWMQLVRTAIDHLHDLTVVLRQPTIDNRELPGAIRSYVDKLPIASNQTVAFASGTCQWI